MKKLFSITGLLVALVLFVVLNVLAGAAMKSSRVDLTENELYTLSDGTRRILGNLQEPIRLRFYFSKKLAADAGASQLTSYAQRVQELLEEYVAASGGKIALEVADPEPFSEDEDRAVGFGLQGAPANARGDLLYFGLAGTNTTDQEEVLPFLDEKRAEFLEYDVTKLVHNLANTKKQVVGVLSSLQLDGNPLARFTNPEADSRPWIIVEQMRELFEVRMIPIAVESIEPDVDLLMIVHPQGISQQALYAVDQFVLGGGKVIAFVDPYCESQEVRQDPQNPMAAMMANRSSDLGPLLAAWGLEMAGDVLAADHDNALRVNFSNQPVDYVVWMGLLGGENGSLDLSDPVTSELEVVQAATVGVLQKKEGATTTVTPLVQTSTNSMRVQKTDVQFGDPVKLLESFVPGGEKLMLAARVSGPAKTAFPGGKPAPPPASDGEPPPSPAAGESLQESKGPINVIVVADADLLADRFWTKSQNFFGQRVVIPTASNGSLVINAIDNMSGSSDLISLRSRGSFTRPFHRVAAIRKQAEINLRQRAKTLEDKLRDTEQKLTELQSRKDGKGALILSPEQQQEIERFREEQVVTRKELRKVRHDMQKDIEDLGTRLKFANIYLVPMLVVAAAIGVAAMRSRRNAHDFRNDPKRS